MLSVLAFTSIDTLSQTETRPRAREVGLKIGILPVGPLNSITDVPGVAVGHTTIIRGENIRTGVTAILPHTGNLFREKVPGAVHIGNGFGKLMGSTQVNELGEIETPIILTSTLAVPRAADFLMDFMLGLMGNEAVQSINPLVAETNDGYLNDIRGRHIVREDVFSAIRNAGTGAVEEGSVGAGTGTVAFGWKGGIGTSSRKLISRLGGYTVGVLVQTNFGGVLSIDGVPVGVELGQYFLRDAVGPPSLQDRTDDVKKTSLNLPNLDAAAFADGSIIIVIATDAPLDHRQLRRLGERAMAGLARTGAAMTNGSGDYVIAFSTADDARIRPVQSGTTTRQARTVANDTISPLFLAAIEATEEAIYNSLFKAATVTGKEKRTIEALPLEPTLGLLRKYGKIK
ncbi:MAG TPA: P1 family peptidase [Pyrinomonadaceae bacterium]|nr:P1 family peptidase [Pyrinomonadaceae bacterium]